MRGPSFKSTSDAQHLLEHSFQVFFENGEENRRAKTGWHQVEQSRLCVPRNNRNNNVSESEHRKVVGTQTLLEQVLREHH